MGAIYVQKDGQQYGPLTRDELQPYLEAGALSVDDWAVEEGGTEWVPLGTLLGAAPPVEEIAVIPEAFREQTEIQVDLKTDAAPGAMADVSAGRKKIAVAVLAVGLLGGGSALGFYLANDVQPEAQPVPNNDSVLADMLKISVGQSSPTPEALPPLELPATKPVPVPLQVNGGADFQKTAEAAEAGHPVGAFHYAVRLREGWGSAPHVSQSVTNAEISEASANGPAAAKVFLGYLYMNNRPPPDKMARVPDLFEEEIVKAAQAEAARPDPYAHYVLGLRELPTRGYRGDLPRALHHFAAAAGLGFPPALYQLGNLHLRGFGVPRNPKVAAEYFAAAAQSGHTEALRLLGMMYSHGDGLAPNPAECIRLTEAAARMGNPDAQFGMASLLAQGKMVDANQTAACQWFLLAAKARPAAWQHALRLKDRLSPEQFQMAADLALAINPAVKVPEIFPTPPGIDKPSGTGPGQLVEPAEPPTAEDSAVSAVKTFLNAAAKRDSLALWAALPAAYQTDANGLAKAAGKRLNPALHASLVNVLRNLKTLFNDQQEFLEAALKEQGDEPDGFLKSLPPIVDAVLSSPLADAQWVANPDLSKLFEGRLLPQLLEVATANDGLFQFDIPADAAEVKVELLDGNATQATVRVMLDEHVETLKLQKVDDKWLPAVVVSAWPGLMLTAREALKAPAEGAVDPQEQVVIMLGAVGGILKSLNDAQTQEEFNERFTGLLELLPADSPPEDPGPLPPAERD